MAVSETNGPVNASFVEARLKRTRSDPSLVPSVKYNSSSFADRREHQPSPAAFKLGRCCGVEKGAARSHAAPPPAPAAPEPPWPPPPPVLPFPPLPELAVEELELAGGISPASS